MKTTPEVEKIIKDFDELWGLTKCLVSGGAIISKNDFQEAWRGKLRTVFTSLTQKHQEEIEKAVENRQNEIFQEIQFWRPFFYDKITEEDKKDLENIIYPTKTDKQ